MVLEERLKRSITQRNDDVFVRGEFDQFGSQSQVSRALKQLITAGKIVKIGVGIYAKAKPSVLSGKPIPVRPVDVLAPDAFKKLGVEIGASSLTQAYNAGESTQIPAGTVFSIGRRRISRKIGFGGRYIKYEKSPAL